MQPTMNSYQSVSALLMVLYRVKGSLHFMNAFLADSILAKLEIWQLQPQFLQGQAYDGAGAMAGASKGAAARITARYPKALYTHCASHRLNLCVVKCCKIQEVNSI